MRSFLYSLSIVLCVSTVIISITVFGLEQPLNVVAGKVGLVVTIITSVLILYTKVVKPLASHIKAAQDREEQFSKVVNQVQAISHELVPNSGCSLRDAVDRIEYKLVIMERVSEAIQQDGKNAMFRCTPDGKNVDVNRTYCRLLKCSKQELMGFGWRNFLACSNGESDKEWKTAFKEGREVNFTINYTTSEGESILADVHAYPIQGLNGEEVVQYLGIICNDK